MAGMAALALSWALAPGGDPGWVLADARVRAEAPPPVRAGGAGEIRIVLLDEIDPDMPLVVWLAGEGVELPDNRLGLADVVDRRKGSTTLLARFVARAEPGVHAVRARVMYVTCVRGYCRPRFGRVAVVVRVEDPVE